MHEQLQYLFDGLVRISEGDYTLMIQRNAEKRRHQNIHFTTEANFLAIGVCIAVYASAIPDRRRQVDFEGLSTILNTCPAFSEQNIDAAQVKRCIEDIWVILKQERSPIALQPPPSIGKRPSTEDLTSVQSKQIKLA